MTISADVLEAMLLAGCTAKQLIAVVRADEEANAERDDKRREQARIRKQRQRERQVMSRMSRDVTHVTRDHDLFVEQKQENAPDVTRDQRDLLSNGLEGSTPPKTLNSHPPSSLRSSGDARVREEFHENFWPAYPHKVGKPEALKAFGRARSRADLDRIMDGLDRYTHKTDDRPWCNPSTWLNQDRWDDQPALFQTGPPTRPKSDFERHQDAVQAELDKATGRKRDDEFTGQTVDLGSADYRPFRASPAAKA